MASYYQPKDRAECEARYGKILIDSDRDLSWAAAAKWILPFEPHPDVSEVLINSLTKKPVSKIYCNVDIHEPLEEAFDNLDSSGLLKLFKDTGKLFTFDGAYALRFVRGNPNLPSSHCFGISVDLNAYDNPLGGPSNQMPEFIEAFESAGWFWGGNFKDRCDPMHFCWAEEGF